MPRDKRIRVEQAERHVEVLLSRPDRLNALDAIMRDELVCALRAIIADPDPVTVCLFGEGSSFCSGGDLDEFGSTPTGGSGHLLRLNRNLPSLLREMSDRLIVGVHGFCIGAGIELAAFAGRVVAADDSRFRLPEVQMGLVPGSGGTVSIPRRVGRPRALWLMVTGTEIDAATARNWGLVDEVVPASELRSRVRNEVRA